MIMTSYLVFVRNQATMQDFAVPAEAASVGEAVADAAGRYPGPVYHALTCFTAAELQSFIDDSVRWPGVASTVQPPLEDLLRKVTAGTKLPPMPKIARRVDLSADEVVVLPEAEAAISEATQARVQALRGAVPGVMEREARIAQATALPPVSDRPKRRSTDAAAPAPAAAPSFNNGRSVIDVLKALRG